MSDTTRIKIAAVVTALFLAGISVTGLAFRDDRPRVAPRATAQPSATLQQSAPVGERSGAKPAEVPYEEREADD
jgi:hypothetical protein